MASTPVYSSDGEPELFDAADIPSLYLPPPDLHGKLRIELSMCLLIYGVHTGQIRSRVTQDTTVITEHRDEAGCKTNRVERRQLVVTEFVTPQAAQATAPLASGTARTQATKEDGNQQGQRDQEPPQCDPNVVR